MAEDGASEIKTEATDMAARAGTGQDGAGDSDGGTPVPAARCRGEGCARGGAGIPHRQLVRPHPRCRVCCLVYRPLHVADSGLRFL